MSPRPTGTSELPVRIAVIGSGLAGLTAAYLFQTLEFEREDGTLCHFQVELFEKGNALGMDAASITVNPEGLEATSFRIDTPMRSVNGGSHNSVFKLYKHLDISLRRSDFSYAFGFVSRPTSHPRRESSPPPPYSATETTRNGSMPRFKEDDLSRPPRQTPLYLYEGSNGLVFPPLAFPTSFSKSSMFTRLRSIVNLILLSLSYLHLLLLAFTYSFLGLAQASSRPASIATRLGLGNIAHESIRDFCERHWVWEGMREGVLVPLHSAVCTIGRDAARDSPVAELLDYIVSTFGASHYVTESGVQQVVRRLSAPLSLDAIHLSSTITGISTSNSTHTLSLDSTPSPAPFHHIVFATQANQAAALLETSDPSLSSPRLLKALSTFSYTRSLVVNHTDSTVLPLSPHDRRDLNISWFPASSSPSKLREEEDEGTEYTVPGDFVQTTHILARTHPRLALTPSQSPGNETALLLQTTNPLHPISPDKTLSSTWYERATVTSASKTVLPRFLFRDEETTGDLQGVGNVWYCGSWAEEGIPLLEGCVRSAKGVVEAAARKEGARVREWPF